jgi:hypothetical protein
VQKETTYSARSIRGLWLADLAIEAKIAQVPRSHEARREIHRAMQDRRCEDASVRASPKSVEVIRIDADIPTEKIRSAPTGTLSVQVNLGARTTKLPNAG